MRHGQGQGLTGGRVDMEDGRFGGFSVILLSLPDYLKRNGYAILFDSP